MRADIQGSGLLHEAVERGRRLSILRRDAANWRTLAQINVLDFAAHP